jgi:hypothetical protein
MAPKKKSKGSQHEGEVGNGEMDIDDDEIKSKGSKLGFGYYLIEEVTMPLAALEFGGSFQSDHKE